MKTILTLLLLVVFNTITAQEYHHNNSKELNTNTPTSKFIQGAFTGTALYIVSNELQRGENKWISHTISIVGSLLIEGIFNSNKTDFEKASFVGLGAVTINVTFEIFKSKKCNKHNY